MKEFCAAFLHLQFGFVILCRKNIGGKAADKRLAKVTTGVYFTNVLPAAFLYKRVLQTFSLLTVWLCNFLTKEYWRKNCLEKGTHTQYRIKVFLGPT